MQNTPAASGTNPLLALLDLIEVPLVLFRPDGRVAHANRAAKNDASKPALVLGSDPQVRARVQGIGEGTTVPSDSLRIDALSDIGAVGLRVRFAPRSIAGMVAATAEVLPAEQPSRAGGSAIEPDPGARRLSLEQIIDVLRGELLPPMQAVLAHAASVEADSTPQLKTAVVHLQERLDRLVDLVEVFGEDVLVTDERVVMVDLVREACQALTPLMRERGISVNFKGERDDLPPVYGSLRMLRRAVHECLHNAITHSRAEAAANLQVGVEVAFRAAGQHLLIGISGMGALSAAALQRHAATLFRAEAVPGKRPPGAAPVLQIGLPLTHRILQLHGGQLRIDGEPGEGLTLMLELPTGAPLRNTHHLDLLQAQIYAEDLSKLMARSRARSTA
jgi:signal transduction histidine kinase